MKASRVRALASVSGIIFSALVFSVAGLVIDRQIQTLLDTRLEDALLAQAKTIAGSLALADTTDPIARTLAFGAISDARTNGGVELAVLLDTRGRVLHADPPLLGDRPYLDLDNAALASALTGKAACGDRFRLNGIDLKTAFAPVFSPFGDVVAVVGIEAPADFFGALRDVRTALIATLALGMVLVASLVVVVWRFWAKSEASERALWDHQQLAVIGQMTATMAHEVRNPLSVIKAAADRIRRKYGDGTELFDFIPEEVDRLDRLTRWYLHFANPGDFSTAHVRVDDVMRDSIAKVRSEMEEAGVEVDLKASARSEHELDYDRMVQANVNILLNARQAIGSNGTITVTIDENARGVRVEVKDTGPGIAAKDQARVFDPFFTTRTAGSGLGLAVVKQVIEAHGGRVGVTSEPGMGATVWYELPAKTTG